jgi:hypothetical protein
MRKSYSSRSNDSALTPNDVLVAILNSPADFALLRDESWYRIPVASAPKPWPPKWLAFDQVTGNIRRLGGLSEDGPVPRVFHSLSEGEVQQLSLLGSSAPPEAEAPENTAPD